MFEPKAGGETQPRSEPRQRGGSTPGWMAGFSPRLSRVRLRSWARPGLDGRRRRVAPLQAGRLQERSALAPLADDGSGARAHRPDRADGREQAPDGDRAGTASGAIRPDAPPQRP